jgi:hypothetical protein
VSRLVVMVLWIGVRRIRAGPPPAGLHGRDRVRHARMKEDEAQAVVAGVAAVATARRQRVDDSGEWERLEP